MARQRTFMDIVHKSFFDEIENRVSLYVEKNFSDMEFNSNVVNAVDEAHVQDVSLHRIVAYDTFGDTLAVDAIAVAEIEIYQVDRNKDLEDSLQKWFRVSCSVKVDNGFTDFKIINVDDEYDHHINKSQDGLNDSLVPIISSADMERHAEDILSNVYPEALEKPMRVNVEMFAQRLGLSIVRKHLSRNGTIFGQMIFHPTNVDFYDLDKKAFDTYEADGGTIFADDEIFFLRSLGSWNNTIIHECVHWIKHRKYIELKRATGADVSRISCQVTEVPPVTKSHKRTDLEWLEWHANALAPRILMPRKQFKQKADELIALYKRNTGVDKIVDVLPSVILELSDFFEVSILSARIRLMDVGFSEAAGVMEYVDGQYVTTHTFKADSLNEKATFTIPMREGIVESAHNPNFVNVLKNGDFVYVDGHYVINVPKYVTTNDFGIMEMTEYALSHMDECCLSFERESRSNPDYNFQRYTECILYQSATAKTITDYIFKQTDNDNDVIARATAIRAELEDVKEAAKMAAKLPGSFGESLKMLMAWRKMTVEILGEKALLDPRTIQRMRNEDERDWDIKRVVAVCIGLQLPPPLSMTLIEKAGLKFRPGEEQFICAHILSTRYTSTIHECNELLEMVGYPPLSGLE